MPKNQPKALLYDPYLTTLGGGERYIVALATAVAERFDTTLAGPKLPPASQLDRLGFDLSGYQLSTISLDNLEEETTQYDLFILLTNELPIRSRAKRNFLVVQFPFERLPRKSLLTRRRHRASLKNYEALVYSQFVRAWLKNRWHISSQILTPPVQLGTYKPAAKRHDIICVGRFIVDGHSKRQDIILESFLRFQESASQNWRLVLAGGVDNQPANQAYLKSLQDRAAGSPNVTFLVNVSQPELAKAYEQAAIFIHAAGFGRPKDQPGKAEHFGITTVEAMSYGCVPVVYADGGQLEIVDDTFGRLWRTQAELEATLMELAPNEGECRKLAQKANASSQSYGYPNFLKKVRTIIK